MKRWEPEFDAISNEQERLVIQFCAEIAGKKGESGSPPDPVRLLEMAEQLYVAERNEMMPMPSVPAEVLAALERMCTPLHESRLKGLTAEMDARCMAMIKSYIMDGARL
jgi:hypothetical protein